MALLVKTSTLPNAGKGLFTTKALKKDSKILEYRGEIIDWKEYEKRVKEDKDPYHLKEIKILQHPEVQSG